MNTPVDAGSRQPKVRMVEFFSGIGGMRLGVAWALENLRNGTEEPEETKELLLDSALHRPAQKEGGSALASCAAYEISLYANATYRHNFSSDAGKQFTLTTKLVEQLRPTDLDGKADLWTMSPPCQPFSTTKGAKHRDSADRRTDGFKALMTLLETINDKPRWILLENVKGFVKSDVLQLWYGTLEKCGYSWREYLLSPIQVGIPNHRTRYYMICELSDRWKGVDGVCPRGELVTQLPTMPNVLPLSCFLQRLDETERLAFVLSDEKLQTDWAKDLPIVSPHDTATHCFTAAYGRIAHKATGSLVMDDLEHAVAQHPLDRSGMMQYTGRLRRFTPKELLCLFGFPNAFQFPDEISLEHQYKLIGNSVSIFVVARVVAELLRDCRVGSTTRAS